MSDNTQFGFNEHRLATLLRYLETNTNVGCVLRELCKLKIPETIAKNYRVVEKVKPFESVPVLDKFVAIIIRKNKRMSEVNRIRRLRDAEKKAKKAKIILVIGNKKTTPPKTVMVDGISTADIQNPISDPPSGRKFPLKFGPGLHHSPNSPFYLVYSMRTFIELLANNAFWTAPAPTTSAAKNENLRGIPYIQDLYERVVRETEELSQIQNPTIDQVLDEMSMLDPNFLLRK
ncbi:unnamed protein product [Caenorhabditis brenneri]